MIDKNIHTHTLKNGIRLIHQNSDSQVGHLGILINTGSRDELPEEHGLAHFIEHSIFKGTNKRKAFHVLSRIESVGGELNAYTTKEETSIYTTFLAQYYNRSAELLSDILFNSSFPEKELLREKEVIVEEINAYKDSPSELIYDDFEEQIFDQHPIARNILGTRKNLVSFNKEMILNFMRNNYHTDEMVISSVGNIDFKKLVKHIEKYFHDIPANLRKNKREEVNGYTQRDQIIDKNTYQAHAIVGNLAFNAKNPHRIPMVLLNSILGGYAMNSRLNLALRERRGLAYSVESSYTAYTDTGVFNVYFGTDKENLDKAKAIVFKEFKTLRTKKLGAIQLKQGKNQLMGQIAIAAEHGEEMMLNNGKSFLLYNKVNPLQRFFDKIDAITAEEIIETANIVLDENQLSTLIYL